MPEVVLQPAVYNPTALGAMCSTQEDAAPPVQGRPLHNAAANANDASTSRYYFSPRFSSTSSTYQQSEGSPVSCEDFPTPKARMFNMTAQPSPRHPLSPSYLSQQHHQHHQHHRVSRTESEYSSGFDPLYDITDDEAEVPLKISASVKKTLVSRSSNRYPSIIIPSPSTWPTIEKLQSALSAVPPTSAQLLTPSRKALSMMFSHNLQVPPHSAAPSLDGSLTSEEMDRLSCPATPDIQKRQGSELDASEWEPMQLDFQALETLQHLGQSEDIAQEQQPQQVIEAGEMQEVSRPFLGLQIPTNVSQTSSIATTPVSALSIPSPGGFFSSLQSTARHTWSIPPFSTAQEDAAPNTSTAEEFYGVPFDKKPRRQTVGHRISTLAGSTLDGFEDAQPTPRPMLPVEEEELEVKEINPSKTIFQYNESYHAELEKMANANLERTTHWLDEQDELQAALREMTDMSSPKSSIAHSRDNSLDKLTRKKSVKFAMDVKESDAEEEEPKKIETYLQGFEYLRQKSQKNDAFIHRQTRAEAMHVRRRCMPKAHRDQLLGKYELADPVRPSPARPVSEFYVNDQTVLKERIARAQTERQALDQMMPSTWVLQVLKKLNGGKLLSKPAARRVLRAQTPRILDVGGAATNDWAWQVAADYPYATVTTVFTAGQNPTTNVSGPANHKATTVPNMWTFPFPSCHFDVISARSLYELLKTDKPVGRSSDEYDLCIKECYRCLKPGGVLDFSLIDTDIIHAGRQTQAMSVEFGFNLKTRGYDANPSKSFLPRLSKAGFSDVKRTWIALPMGSTAANWKDVLPVGANTEEERSISPDGDVQVSPAPVYGSTVDAAMMTGVVGSWLYERWMLKLQTEMGKDEDRLLDGVVAVLEECAQQGSAWRYLTGYARK